MAGLNAWARGAMIGASIGRRVARKPDVTPEMLYDASVYAVDAATAICGSDKARREASREAIRCFRMEVEEAAGFTVAQVIAGAGFNKIDERA